MFDSLHKKLFPKKIQDAMDAMTVLHNTPDEMVIPIILSVANFATQGHFDIDPIIWKKCIMSLYFTVINKSGGRKSTNLEEVMAGIKEFEQDEKARYLKEISIYHIEHALWEKEFKKAIKDRTTIPKEPSRPIEFNYVLGKATANGLLDALYGVPFCSLINPDAAEFYNSYSFQDSKSGRDTEMITILSKLFSGERVGRLTGVKENNIVVEGRRFGMLTMLQEEMANFLANENYRDQGFIPRLLITVVPDYDKGIVSFSEVSNAEKDKQRKKIDPFNDRIYDLLTTATQKSNDLKSVNRKYQTAQSMTHVAEDKCDLMLPLMSVDPKAMPIFEKFVNESEVLSRSPSHSGYASFMVRRYEIALRIAATLATFEGDDLITEQWATLAIALTEWFTEQRLNMEITTNDKKKPVLEIGTKLVAWMRAKDYKTISVSDAVRRGPPSYQKTTSDERSKVLTELMARSLVKVEKDELTSKTMITIL
jgi:hypothetical protein